MTRTLSCIVTPCTNLAKIYCGHVHKNKRKVIAGYCRQHEQASIQFIKGKDCQGCHGIWREENSEEYIPRTNPSQEYEW